jgi:phosphatidate cytidylyltransferase
MPGDATLEDVRPVLDRPRSKELVLRILSGIVLAAVALVLAHAGPMTFAALVAAVALLMSWEWARIVRGVRYDAAFGVHAAAVVGAIALTVAGFEALALTTIAVGAAVIVPLQFGARAFASAMGVAYVGLPAIALAGLRCDEPFGEFAVLFVFIVVWLTDTCAYAAGRLIGGPKLWRRVSPNKTWSGLVGGVGAAVLGAVVFALAIGAPPLFLATLALALGLVAQAGDLAESALKRGYGVKDASGLIPGHGGFMDRLDSVVAVSICAALVGLALDYQAPARALLFGA